MTVLLPVTWPWVMPVRRNMACLPASRSSAALAYAAAMAGEAARCPNTAEESATLKDSWGSTAHSGQVRVPDGEPKDLMLGAQPAQQLFRARAGGQFIGHHEQQEPALDRAGHVLQLVLDPAGAGVQACSRVNLPQEPFEVRFPGLGRKGTCAVGVPADQAHHVAVPVGQVAHHTKRHHGDILLGFAVTGFGGHVPAGIGDQQDGLPPHRHIPLDQRGAVAGGSLPVNVADLVAGNVRTEVVKVQAAATED